MAHSTSAQKRVRQNERRRLANRARKAQMRTQIKKVYDAVQSGDAEQARIELGFAMKLTDKTAKRNTIHRNTAARIKSALSRAVNGIS